MNTHATAPQHRPLRLPALGGWLLATFFFAAIGAAASIQAQSFYLQLNRPDWAPAPNVFGPVWSILYALMAVAAWRVQRCASPLARRALVLYTVQLALNALWTWLFFGWHLGGLAFAEIIVLWLFIAATIAAFHRRDRWAGLMLLPYILWVSFATCLCYSIWQRNPVLL
ncbi:TspO/MBR family protein [Duganella callida]|uniref:Tryptophan-rich sensory protein n=1 Tax=Duganella callida TaxID=2561932 RepID=A0A4Y9SGM3_9BURK|nr:TspO/MBR family protein [Duganella callida]TFW19361.1 tryptophan-rich sensory protein [Duganella callida]